MIKKPLYLLIAEQLTHQIQKGGFAIGQTLPSEPLLAASLNISRTTLRLALDELEKKGLILRRKNVGTRVVALQAKEAYTTSLTSINDLVNWAKTCERKIQDVALLSVKPKDLLDSDFANSEHIFQIKSLRMEGEFAVALTCAYFPEAYASALGQIESAPKALISDVLCQTFDLQLTKIAQETKACQLKTEDAVLLNCKKNALGLAVTRRYMTDTNQTVLITVTIHPAERFSLKTMLTKQ